MLEDGGKKTQYKKLFLPKLGALLKLWMPGIVLFFIIASNKGG